MLLLLLLSSLCNAGQYDHAIKTTVTAIGKQTGLEADFLKVRSAANKGVVKWARKKGLEVPLTVVSFVGPVVYRKQMRIKTGDFTFRGTSSRVTLDWHLEF